MMLSFGFFIRGTPSIDFSDIGFFFAPNEPEPGGLIFTGRVSIVSIGRPARMAMFEPASASTDPSDT